MRITIQYQSNFASGATPEPGSETSLAISKLKNDELHLSAKFSDARGRQDTRVDEAQVTLTRDEAIRLAQALVRALASDGPVLMESL